MRGILVVSVIFGAACASSGAVQQSGGKASARCAAIVSDTLLGGTAVFPSCGVSREAKLVSPALRPQYTPGAGVRCARARVDVVVDAAGKPVMSTARVVRATDPSLATAIISALSGAKYDPATKDGVAVAQIIEVEWTMSLMVAPAGTSPGTMRAQRAGRPQC